MNTNEGLMPVGRAADLIRAGKYLSIGGDEQALRQLPAGNWIGGTIPYFMANDGGKISRDQVFVHEIKGFSAPPIMRSERGGSGAFGTTSKSVSRRGRSSTGIDRPFASTSISPSARRCTQKCASSATTPSRGQASNLGGAVSVAMHEHASAGDGARVSAAPRIASWARRERGIARRKSRPGYMRRCERACILAALCHTAPT